MSFDDSAAASTLTMETTIFCADSNSNCCSCSFSTSWEKTKKKKKKRQIKEAKYELVRYDSLPSFLKHNEFILGYYRSEWPLKQTLLSIFSIHNETLNVWTHLIGFFVFLALTAGVMTMFPATTTSTSSILQHHQLENTSSFPSYTSYFASFTLPLNLSQVSLQANETGTAVTSAAEQNQAISRWPFYAYMFGAMFCLLMSSACHLLSCHSKHTCYVMLRLDYAGISALIVTSFYPLVYYSFACQPFIRGIYLGSITVFGLAAIFVSLVPVFEKPEFRMARAGLFVCMGLSGLVPIVHKLLVFGDRPEAVVTAGYEMVMGAFYALGVIVYASRVPERWMPGLFDLAGHSHQLFHVLVVAGAYTHYLAGLVYLSWREMEGCSSLGEI